MKLQDLFEHYDDYHHRMKMDSIEQEVFKYLEDKYTNMDSERFNNLVDFVVSSGGEDAIIWDVDGPEVDREVVDKLVTQFHYKLNRDKQPKREHKVITKNGQTVDCYGKWTPSSNALATFADESLDGVYADGGSSWEVVVNKLTKFAQRNGTELLELQAD